MQCPWHALPETHPGCFPIVPLRVLYFRCFNVIKHSSNLDFGIFISISSFYDNFHNNCQRTNWPINKQWQMKMWVLKLPVMHALGNPTSLLTSSGICTHIYISCLLYMYILVKLKTEFKKEKLLKREWRLSFKVDEMGLHISVGSTGSHWAGLELLSSCVQALQ